MASPSSVFSRHPKLTTSIRGRPCPRSSLPPGRPSARARPPDTRSRAPPRASGPSRAARSAPGDARSPRRRRRPEPQAKVRPAPRSQTRRTILSGASTWQKPILARSGNSASCSKPGPSRAAAWASSVNSVACGLPMLQAAGSPGSEQVQRIHSAGQRAPPPRPAARRPCPRGTAHPPAARPAGRPPASGSPGRGAPSPRTAAPPRSASRCRTRRPRCHRGCGCA